MAILKIWGEQNIFEKSISTRDGKSGFTFYEGPPTANGKPGIHHVFARTLKDLICRYKTMRGFQVHRKAGWDTHGLPVEIEVEKSLGFKHKDEIVKYGIEKFNEECKKSVWKYKNDWERMTTRMGYWVNLDEPYVTFENNYIESIWWALKQYFDKGLLYKGFKIQPYCPRCETPLSSHEVSLGYENVTDNSVFIKFKLKNEANTFILSWTTTPWTLPGNIALAVGEKIDYVKIKVGDEFWILANDCLGVISDVGKVSSPELRVTSSEKENLQLETRNSQLGSYEIVEHILGKDLVGKEYIPLFEVDTLKSETSYKVYTADFVTTTDGTGVVHTAVMYGEDDYQLGKRVGLPQYHTVDRSGNFKSDVKELAGLYVKDKATEKKIFSHLKEKNNFVKHLPYAHEYPHCWRCKNPLLYYARDSWYIATTKYAKRMVELNKQINWYPKEVGEGRFGNWLEENKDWSLSRDRFWGTPLPIWICADCGKLECVGSVRELEERVTSYELRVTSLGKDNSQLATRNSQLDLHKPFVDGITWKCSCGGTMKRTPELIDVWFDSGAMQFAQWHYPFENKHIFDAQHPADYICEGIDQTRGWFYSLHSISTFLFDKPAYKNVVVNELILDKDGQKMSKSKGNTVDPFMILEKYGADTTRWYLVTTSPPWKPTLFDEAGLAEVQRKFFGTLLNTYSFFSLYANVDGFTFKEKVEDSQWREVPLNERPEIDRWIISSLNTLVKSYDEMMDAYEIMKAARAVSDFTIDQLSNWYVRRNRRRFWKSESGSDKLAAYQTLYECLITISKLIAPFAPFIAEELFRNLNSVTKKESVESIHLALLPKVNENAIDKELEQRMDKAERIVILVRSMRTKSNLKVRQPLKRILIPIANQRDKEMIQRMENVIIEEINVKAIEYVAMDNAIIRRKVKPNFKALGAKHGKLTPKVALAVQQLSSQQILHLDVEGKISLEVESQNVLIEKSDVEILSEDIQGWLVASDNEITVALDTELSEELVNEGLAREFVNRIQNLRKDSNFEITDRIKIFYKTTERLHNAISTMKEYVQNETLAFSLFSTINNGDVSQSFDVNGEMCEIVIHRITL
ncbi:MAG: isoleucine--tRNA ligase [Ignavibacteria bacterium]|nr:isoleucine--tRNA ligase [Ignavibacteria bacterium]